jgi:polar amino acid transport system substrate-binding protein
MPVTSAATALACGIVVGAALCGAADARSLDSIRQRGAIALCAHPNSLPFANRKGEPAGFQVELGQEIADRLGVRLERHWITNSYQIRRADCDIVMDAIGDRAALIEFGLRASRPYQRSGVVLAVRADDTRIASLDDLGSNRRVGVQVGSVASMILDQRGVATTPFAFEDDMLEALVHREVDAVAVTPASAGYHNLSHDPKVRAVPAFDGDPQLSWNVAVGMLKPDDSLRARMDAVVTEMIEDGTVDRIYARYGIAARPPE